MRLVFITRTIVNIWLMFIFYPTRGFIENNECIVGDHLVSLPVVSCMARGILLRWMVRLFIAI